MSVAGIRANTEINLDELERRVRAPTAQHASAEDALAELVRLIESLGRPPGRSPPPVQTMSKSGPTATEPVQPPEMASLQPLTGLPPDEPSGTASVDIEEPESSEFASSYLRYPDGADLATERLSGGLILKDSALALAGVALIGVVFWLNGGAPGRPKAPPFIAAAQGPTKAPEPSSGSVTTSSDAGATALKDITQPAHVELVGSQVQPIDLNAHASPGDTSPSAALAPRLAGAAQPTEGAPRGVPGAVAVAPVVPAPIAAPPPAASQFPDSKPVRTASLPPDAEPNATVAASSTDSGEAAHAIDAPQPPAKGASEAAVVEQPSTPKLDMPAKQSRRSSARVVAAKTDATAPGAAAGSEPLHLGASMTPQAPAEPEAAPPAPPTAAQQPANPLTHAFSYVVGAVGALGAPAASVLKPAASESGDWAIQFAAPKSEAEAEADAARLNAKYARALNGATIGVHKTLVNGETIYALRVAGLSAADAAAMCARVKGRDCFIAK